MFQRVNNPSVRFHQLYSVESLIVKYWSTLKECDKMTRFLLLFFVLRVWWMCTDYMSDTAEMWQDVRCRLGGKESKKGGKGKQGSFSLFLNLPLCDCRLCWAGVLDVQKTNVIKQHFHCAISWLWCFLEEEESREPINKIILASLHFYCPIFRRGLGHPMHPLSIVATVEQNTLSMHKSNKHQNVSNYWAA